jgi:hypothetical protein
MSDVLGPKFRLENIAYAILRKCFRRVPLSSLPLLSGDSYRKLCHIDLSDKSIDLLNGLSSFTHTSIFLQVSRTNEMALWVSENNLKDTNWQLILHNGDHSVKESDMRKIKAAFRQVSSVNWLGDFRMATPIPIGLENRNYFQNGIKHHYGFLPSKVFKDWANREHKVFLSFKRENNLKYRMGLETHVNFSDENFISDKFLSPTIYRRLVRNSQFVISPPGNGYDCHRTWEAIYLGAVPIVLRKFWNFGGDLPVLIVDDYSQIEAAVSNFTINFDYFDFEPRKVLFQRFITNIFRSY